MTESRRRYNSSNPYLICLTILLIFFLAGLFPAQSVDSIKKVLVAPGSEYKANTFHELIFGSHWRDLWVTPVEVEVLDLNTFQGGIIPFKKGGGFQTKSLQFKSRDGYIWKFRSISKDPRKVLPEDLRESLAGDVIQDQVSSSNPMAPLVVVPLLNAVNVLQAEPKLVIMPDDEKLGEFRAEYAGLLGMIELHPDENDLLDTTFAGAEKILGTFKLLDRLEEKRDEKVSSSDFLKARLMDILLGDWDRHTDQWRWARYSFGEKELWFPIPRDRDQAFAKLDGVFPTIARYLVPQLNHFDYDFPSIQKITWSGRFLDRRFLSELTPVQWDSVTSFILERITDDVVDEAVDRLPLQHKKIAGEELRNKLISRRNNLVEISNDFYKLINGVVDIYATSKDDYIFINRISDEKISVELFKRNKKSGMKEGTPFYHRVFDNYFTSEIRIYALGGDDKILVQGNTDCSPLVRVIGGEGMDEFIDSSNVLGNFLLFTPIHDQENKTEFYDSGKKTSVNYNPGTSYDDSEIILPQDDFEKYEPKQKDRGSDLYIVPLIDYDSDNGIILSIGPLFYKYNFRTEPYEYRMRLIGSYSERPKSYGVDFSSRFYSLIKGTRIDLKIFKSELSLTKYYGYGNETSFNKDLDKTNYYLLDRELVKVSPIIGIKAEENTYLTAGLSYDYSEAHLKNDSLFYNFPQIRYGEGKIHSMSLIAGIEFDNRDNVDYPQSGLFLNLTGIIVPEFLDVNESYSKAAFEMRKYITTNFITESTLALRIGGEKVWGNYPFYESAFLGGNRNLRGYNRERFSGDAMLFAQAEIRPFISEIKIILKGKLGLNLFMETGRVFTTNIPSNKWHLSYGGGIWISYLQKQLILSLTVAKSPENMLFYFGSRLMF